MKSRASFLAFLVRQHKQGKGRRGIQHFTSSEVSALALRVSPFPLLQMLDRNDNSHVQTPTARTRFPACRDPTSEQDRPDFF
jgi:hypothetical protein